MSGPKGLKAGIFGFFSRKTSKTRALIPALSKVAPSKAHKTHNPKTHKPTTRRVRNGASRVWRAVQVELGSFLVILGIVIAPLPGPLGMPVSIAGLIVVLRNSYWAKRQFVRTYRRYPKWLSPVRRLLRPRARIVSIIWQQMLRTEKLVLSKARDRVLGPVRRRFLRKSRRSAFRTQTAK